MPAKRTSLKKPLKPKKSSRYSFLWFFFLTLFSVWFVWRSLTPQLPKTNEPPRFYSNQCQQDLTLTLLEAIHQAQNSLHLIMFGCSDPAILKTLKKKSIKVPTTVYYDPSASPNLQRLLRTCTAYPVRQKGLMHQKILIIDDEMVFLGSANMTTPSLKMHDNLVIGFSSKHIASFLKDTVPYSSGHLHTFLGKQSVDIWVLPDIEGAALRALRHHLHNATHSIRIALFTFTHPALLDDLLAAHDRGVEVTLIVDMHSGLGASAKNIEILRKAGVPVLLSQGIQLLHHKFAYIDNQILVTGSANWTKAAFTKNSDCLFCLHPLNLEQKNFLNSLWHRIYATAKAPDA